MKIKIIIICLLATSQCYAQRDYCSEIMTTGSELTGKKFYRTYVEWITKNESIAPMAVSSSDNKAFAIEFKMVSSVLSINLQGVYIKFEDGFLFKNEKLKMDVEVNESGQYEYTATLIVDNDLLSKLTTSKITDVNYALSGDVHLKPENSEAFKQHFICLKSLIK